MPPHSPRGPVPHIGRPTTPTGPNGVRSADRVPPFGAKGRDLRRCPPPTARRYREVVSLSRRSWAAPAGPAAASDEMPLPDLSRSHAGRERVVDALAVLLAAVLGALFLSPELHDSPDPLSTTQVAVDVTAGALACLALWGRRRWPVGVALACLLLGVVSTSATPAGLLALASLAVHRPARATVVVTLLWIPSVLAFAVYSPTTGPVSVLALVMPLALAASGWGMYVRARRQLLLSLRERALRAEADQELHEEQARVAERTRIAREMHDVLAHRISLMALHAGGLEVRPDLPPAQVQETAALLRATARQALEELRGVIGVLREDDGRDPAPASPQPTLHDIPRLVEETRSAGADIDFEMRLAHADDVPARWDATPTGSCRRRSPTSASTPSGARPGCGSPAPPATACTSASATASRCRARADRRCPAPAPGCSGCRNGSHWPVAPSCTAPTGPATSWWRRS